MHFHVTVAHGKSYIYNLFKLYPFVSGNILGCHVGVEGKWYYYKTVWGFIVYYMYCTKPILVIFADICPNVNILPIFFMPSGCKL